MPLENEDGRPTEPNTWLVIPYFPDDFGRPGIERPLDPSQAISWLSPAIIIDDTRGKTSLVRGVPVSVTVDVANWGAGGLTAPVQVRVWWADPTLTFLSANPFGQAVLLARAGAGPVRSPAIVGTIPTSAPAHVCLLVHVSAPMDSSPPGSVPDPASDRHWAQLNLTETVATSDGAFQFSANIGNPFDKEMVSRFRVETLPEIQVEQLARRLGRELGTADLAEIEIRLAGEVTEGKFRLGPREQLPLEVNGRVTRLASGETAAITLTQIVFHEGLERGLNGGLGVLVTLAER